MLKHQIARYLDQLDVCENLHLSLSFSNSMPDQLQGITFCLNSPPPPTYQIIRIWMDARLKKSELDFALAHEMVHVKQYAQKELVVLSEEKLLWKGQMFALQCPADR